MIISFINKVMINNKGTKEAISVNHPLDTSHPHNYCQWWTLDLAHFRSGWLVQEDREQWLEAGVWPPGPAPDRSHYLGDEQQEVPVLPRQGVYHQRSKVDASLRSVCYLPLFSYTYSICHTMNNNYTAWDVKIWRNMGLL